MLSRTPAFLTRFDVSCTGLGPFTGWPWTWAFWTWGWVGSGVVLELVSWSCDFRNFNFYPMLKNASVGPTEMRDLVEGRGLRLWDGIDDHTLPTWSTEAEDRYQ